MCWFCIKENGCRRRSGFLLKSSNEMREFSSTTIYNLTEAESTPFQQTLSITAFVTGGFIAVLLY